MSQPSRIAVRRGRSLNAPCGPSSVRAIVRNSAPSGISTATIATAPPFRRVLGSAFEAMPQRLRELHGTSAHQRWSGRAQVRRGRGPLARIIAAVIGFPPAGEGVFAQAISSGIGAGLKP